MTIRITRNAAGNCLNFIGSSMPAYFNACLSGQVDATDDTRVNVVNDVQTANDPNAEIRYEFYQIPFTEFSDKDGNSFATAQETAAYITEQGNVLGTSDTGTDLTGIAVNFRLDQTNTSIIMDNGSAFGVNTIKAVPNADGTIHIHAIGAEAPNTAATANEHKFFEKLESANVSVNGVAVGGGLNDVANALNELFTVGPFESVVINDPYSTMIADVNGTLEGYTLEGSGAIDPAGGDIFTNTSTGNYAGLKSIATISKAGEYFTFDIRGEGQIGFGLLHSDASFAAGRYQGNATYADPATFAVGNSAHYGYQFSHWFHQTPNGSWTNYGASTGVVYGPGWYNWESQADWLADNPVKIKVGIDENGFIAISSLQSDNTTWILHARSSYPVPQDSEFHLGIKSANPAARVFSAPKVHRLAVDDTPVVIGDSSITVFGTDVSGDLASGITYSGNSNDDNNGFVSAETLTQPGEYFQFTWTDGDANLGLFSENDHAIADLDANRAAWGNDDYLFFGARSEQNGVLNGMYNENSYASTVLEGQIGAYYGRVGFDVEGRATVWASTDGVTYTVKQRLNAAAPTGTYRFVWIAQDPNANISTLTKGQLAIGPTLYFRYVESPDGNFEYPLFATAEEANYYDLNHSGTNGTGTSHQHVYVDDPTATTWYMPETGRIMNGATLPQDAAHTVFMGNAVTYTEITTLTDADLAPPAFSGLDHTFAEGATVALQVSPQDASWTTTVSGLPDGLSLNGGYAIQGTTRYVFGDQDYTITVTRTNSYGSSQGTFDLKIVDDVTQNAISGMTIYGQNPITQSPDTVHHYSGAVNLDVDLSLDAGTEIIWTQQNDNPQGGVGQYLQIGIADVGVDKATTQLGNNPQHWQVKATIWTGTLNHNYATGWTDSSSASYAESNDNVEWKIAFPSDNGPIELYRAGVLVRTSSDNFSGSQTLTVGVPVNYSTTTRMPSFVKADIVFAGDPPTGFTQEYGSMDSATTLSPDSVVSLGMVLPVGKRLLVNKAWVEANVLPYSTDSLEKAYIGVPKTTAAWGSIDLHTDFDAVMRWEGQSSDSHKTTIADGSDAVARHESNIGSATNAYYHYAIEWDGTNLTVLRDTDISKFSNEHDKYQFSSYSCYENYAAQSGDLPLVMATKSGGTMTLSMSGISLVDVPSAPATILTPWTKALDFSGSAERTIQVSTSSVYNPLQMAGVSVTTAAPGVAGNTSTDTNARPWATAIVFRPDGNSSNQHVWNLGEGSGTNDDNIYLRLDASGNLYFGWGRSGSLNECVIGAGFNAGAGINQFWGAYIAHNGTRLSGNDATVSNLAECFDIRIMNNQGGTWQIAGAGGTFADAVGNRSTVANWSRSGSNTGGRMDRQFTGSMTVGGRNANRSFHGKVASFVTTTLERGAAMPTDAEITKMVTDPSGWLADYKVGNSYRRADQNYNNASFALNGFSEAGATQVWLMGDGTYDAYAKIRNQVFAADQNATPMNMISMVSNDIETVSIPGLS